MDAKPTSIPYRRKRHDAYQHNAAPRLEGIVKNRGIKPARKHKRARRAISARKVTEAVAYAQEQLQSWEPE